MKLQVVAINTEPLSPINKTGFKVATAKTKGGVALYGIAATLPILGIGVPVGEFFGIQVSFLFSIALIIMMGFFVSKRGLLYAPAVSVTLLAFWLVCTISISMSANLPFEEFRGELPWLRSIKQWLGLTFMVLMYFALTTFINTNEKFLRFVSIYLASAFFVSLLGVYQFLSIYFSLNLPFEHLPVTNPSFGEARGIAIWDELPRPSSTLVEPAYFGNYLVTAIPIILAGIIYKQYFFAKSRAGLFFVASLLFSALVMTFSRAPYLGLIVAVVFFYLAHNRFNAFKWVVMFAKFVPIFVMMLVTVSLVTMRNIPGLLWERIYSATQIGYDFSVLERFTMIVTQFNILKSYPVLGVGIGNFGFYYLDFKPEWGFAFAELGTSFFSPQNVFGQVMAETGLLGIVLFCSMLLQVVRMGLKTYRCSNSALHKACSLGLVSGFVGYMTTLLAVGCFYNLPFMWVLMGLIVAQYRLQKNSWANGLVKN